MTNKNLSNKDKEKSNISLNKEEVDKKDVKVNKMILEAEEVKEINISHHKDSIKQEHKNVDKSAKVESVILDKNEEKVTETNIETQNNPIDISPEKIEPTENKNNTSVDLVEFNEKDIIDLNEESKSQINKKLKVLDNNWNHFSKYNQLIKIFDL
jgi:hypothetical protein